jgi:hypothetical protein
MAVYTFLDLAAETLLATGEKATIEKIWEAAVKAGIDSKLRKKGRLLGRLSDRGSIAM